MIRTVSLWIRLKGCSSQIKPTYLDSKHTRLKSQDGEYYIRYARKWEAVGTDPLLALDAKAAKEKLLREAGVPEEMIAEFTRPGIQPGMSFGGAKPVDVMNVVERVLFGQNAGHVLLRVKRPPFDEAGHVEIEVLEVGLVKTERYVLERAVYVAHVMK